MLMEFINDIDGERETISTYLEHADSSIDSCIQRAVQFHGEGVRAVGGVVTDTLYDRLQLLHVVHHHLYSVLHRVQRGLGTNTGKFTGDFLSLLWPTLEQKPTLF